MEEAKKLETLDQISLMLVLQEEKTVNEKMRTRQTRAIKVCSNLEEVWAEISKRDPKFKHEDAVGEGSKIFKNVEQELDFFGIDVKDLKVCWRPMNTIQKEPIYRLLIERRIDFNSKLKMYLLGNFYAFLPETLASGERYLLYITGKENTAYFIDVLDKDEQRLAKQID